MFKKNKKGISPLIATVLIIGFTIVLAALVITWGTKLFKSTVSETESTSKFNLACTAGLNLELTPKKVDANNMELTMRNNNQDRAIDDFQIIVYDSDGKVEKILEANLVASGDEPKKLEFPVPKKYTAKTVAADVTKTTKIEVYPVFVIDGQTKACQSPVEAKLI